MIASDPIVDDAFADATFCEQCGRENCEGHDEDETPKGFPDDELEDAVVVAERGRTIAAEGVPYAWDGVIPDYGMLGMLVAYAKVGKTTLGQAIAVAVALGLGFLGRTTKQRRVLILAAEDPAEYTAYLARHIDVPPGVLTFRCKSLILTPAELDRIVATIKKHNFGLVLIASWQAVVRTLIREENDNAGAVRVMEDVKAAARVSGVPWLIDAHSGKGEDQSDDADPSKAMRGASGAAGAADYTLSLRYANGAFGTQRRLSGKGRFVNLEPVTIDYDPQAGTYTLINTTKDAMSDTTWQLICEAGILSETPTSTKDIAIACGLVGKDGKPSNTHRRQIDNALKGRPDVLTSEEPRKGQKAKCYRRVKMS